ncbi:hypothetical protein D9758_010914 [Tetrapyrgos nigripes]|uniref:TERF2-interacting telomeric protein 1 Myb domain-containing protein n=1 Tax=Tetrapyrgos nigripes TaxID=182062 RepID=A0A8H5CVM1_9AGAR|nr:hypothetical protein D9758_010914 [Tetrapyrgos nigripes]
MGSRVAFTEEDDRRLAEFIAFFSAANNRRGNVIYKMLTDNKDNLWPWSSRHTWHSWRDRYVKRQDAFDRMIRKIQTGATIVGQATPGASNAQAGPGPSTLAARRADTMGATNATRKRRRSSSPGDSGAQAVSPKKKTARGRPTTKRVPARRQEFVDEDSDEEVQPKMHSNAATSHQPIQNSDAESEENVSERVEVQNLLSLDNEHANRPRVVPDHREYVNLEALPPREDPRLSTPLIIVAANSEEAASSKLGSGLDSDVEEDMVEETVPATSKSGAIPFSRPSPAFMTTGKSKTITAQSNNDANRANIDTSLRTHPKSENHPPNSKLAISFSTSASGVAVGADSEKTSQAQVGRPIKENGKERALPALSLYGEGSHGVVASMERGDFSTENNPAVPLRSSAKLFPHKETVVEASPAKHRGSGTYPIRAGHPQERAVATSYPVLSASKPSPLANEIVEDSETETESEPEAETKLAPPAACSRSSTPVSDGGEGVRAGSRPSGSMESISLNQGSYEEESGYDLVVEDLHDIDATQRIGIDGVAWDDYRVHDLRDLEQTQNIHDYVLGDDEGIGTQDVEMGSPPIQDCHEEDKENRQASSLPHLLQHEASRSLSRSSTRSSLSSSQSQEPHQHHPFSQTQTQVPAWMLESQSSQSTHPFDHSSEESQTQATRGDNSLGSQESPATLDEGLRTMSRALKFYLPDPSSSNSEDRSHHGQGASSCASSGHEREDGLSLHKHHRDDDKAKGVLSMLSGQGRTLARRRTELHDEATEDEETNDEGEDFRCGSPSSLFSVCPSPTPGSDDTVELEEAEDTDASDTEAYVDRTLIRVAERYGFPKMYVRELWKSVRDCVQEDAVGDGLAEVQRIIETLDGVKAAMLDEWRFRKKSIV